MHIAVGTRIRFLRKQAGLTICQLAEMAGVDGGFVNCIENAKKTPSLRTLAKLAKALDVPMVEMFTERAQEAENIFDHQISSQIRAILNGKPREEREKFLAVLKTLKNKETLSAIFEILRMGNRTRRPTPTELMPNRESARPRE